MKHRLTDVAFGRLADALGITGALWSRRSYHVTGAGCQLLLSISAGCLAMEIRACPAAPCRLNYASPMVAEQMDAKEHHGDRTIRPRHLGTDG